MGVSEALDKAEELRKDIGTKISVFTSSVDQMVRLEDIEYKFSPKDKREYLSECLDIYKVRLQERWQEVLPLLLPGSIVFEDDFSVDLSKWDVANSTGEWMIEDEELHGRATASVWQWLFTHPDYGTTADFILESKVKRFGGIHYMIAFRVQDSANYYAYRFYPATNQCILYRCQGGTFRTLAYTPPGIGLAVTETRTLKVVCEGVKITCYYDDEMVLMARDWTYSEGRCGYIIHTTTSHFHFDDFWWWNLGG